jgi:hypothetical protein
VTARFSALVQTGPAPPPRLLYNGYRFSLSGVKRPERGVNHPPPSSAEVKERVDLYIYSLSAPSWPVLGRTLPLLASVVNRTPISRSSGPSPANIPDEPQLQDYKLKIQATYTKAHKRTFWGGGNRGQYDQAAALCIQRFLARNKPQNLTPVLRGGTEDRRKRGHTKSSTATTTQSATVTSGMCVCVCVTRQPIASASDAAARRENRKFRVNDNELYRRKYFGVTENSREGEETNNKQKSKLLQRLQSCGMRRCVIRHAATLRGTCSLPSSACRSEMLMATKLHGVTTLRPTLKRIRPPPLA